MEDILTALGYLDIHTILEIDPNFAEKVEKVEEKVQNTLNDLGKEEAELNARLSTLSAQRKTMNLKLDAVSKFKRISKKK